jgi:hypothetical protein
MNTEMNFETHLFNFLKELGRFTYELSVSDKIWKIIFPGNSDTWYYIHITQYQDTYYISLVDGNNCSLEAVPRKFVKPVQAFGSFQEDDGHYDPASVWQPIIREAQKWLQKAERNWIKANKTVIDNYPLNRRTGVAPHNLIRNSLNDWFRIDEKVGKSKCRKFIRLVEDGFFNHKENFTRRDMTVNDYFEYCRIAYFAGRRKGEKVDTTLSGRTLYERYADGRHEGLMDIAPESTKEFSDWIDGKHPKKSSGGHPWEIKRGGNTTHIDLSVYRHPYRPEEGFVTELRGESFTRIAETIRMYLALNEAGMPVTIANPEALRMRLLAQDNIGIIPVYANLHRANQNFPKEQHVYDVMHYDDLGRYKRRIAPFITWEALPILKPANQFQ